MVSTFKAATRKSMSEPFFRVPNGGFITTVSTILPTSMNTLDKETIQTWHWLKWKNVAAHLTTNYLLFSSNNWETHNSVINELLN